MERKWIWNMGLEVWVAVLWSSLPCEHRLLAIKRFRPSTEFKTHGGETLLYWLKAVFHDYGLSMNHMLGSTTDKGADVWKLCCSILGKVRCI